MAEVAARPRTEVRPGERIGFADPAEDSHADH